VADERFEAWKQEKSGRVETKKEGLNKKQADAKQAQLDAERKVSETRAAAIAKKNAVEEAPVAEAATEAPAEDAAE
jgi:small subunit ribosomal protein S16